MKKRIEIIEKSGANLVVSIHMNSFPLRSSRGAQVFYKEDNASSQFLANNIQQVFYENLPHGRKEAKPGDYYILNESPIPSVIVECGFLSNKEDEQLLQDSIYRSKVCTAIAYGIIISL